MAPQQRKSTRREKWQTYMTAGVIVEAAAIITLAPITALHYRKLKALQKAKCTN